MKKRRNPDPARQRRQTHNARKAKAREIVRLQLLGTLAGRRAAAGLPPRRRAALKPHLAVAAAAAGIFFLEGGF